MIVRKTTPQEGQRVNELFAIAFELPLKQAPLIPKTTGSTTGLPLPKTGPK